MNDDSKQVSDLKGTSKQIVIRAKELQKSGSGGIISAKRNDPSMSGQVSGGVIQSALAKLKKQRKNEHTRCTPKGGRSPDDDAIILAKQLMEMWEDI